MLSVALLVSSGLQAVGTRIGITKSWPLGPSWAIAADSTYVYVTSGNALLIFALADLPSAAPISQLDLHVFVNDLAVFGNRVVAITDTSVVVIDVADPTRPGVTALFQGLIDNGPPAMVGDVLYVADLFGVHSYDLAVNPPVQIHNLAPGAVLFGGLAEHGGVAFVPEGTSGIHLVQVNSSGDITPLSNFDGYAPVNQEQAGRFRVFGNWLYDLDETFSGAFTTTAPERGLRFFDVTTPATPVSLGIYATAGAIDVAASPGIDRAYLAYGMGGIAEIDTTKPSTPALLQTVTSADNAPFKRLAISGDTLLAANDSDGFKAFDTTSSPALADLGGADVPARSVDLLRYGAYTYVASLGDGVSVLTADACGRLSRSGESVDAGSVTNLAQADNYLYASTSSGVKVLDLSDPLHPTYTYSGSNPLLNTGGATELATDGTHLAVNAFGVYRWFTLGDPGAPSFEGQFSLAGNGIAVHKDRLYVAAGTAGLKIIDMTTSALLGTADTPGDAKAVAVSGNTAYVADGTSPNYLTVVDVTDPAHPTVQGSVSALTTSTAVIDRVAVLDDGRVAIGGANDRLVHLVDVTNPAAPVEESSATTESGVDALYVEGSDLWVAADFGVRRMSNHMFDSSFEPTCWDEQTP